MKIIIELDSPFLITLKQISINYRSFSKRLLFIIVAFINFLIIGVPVAVIGQNIELDSLKSGIESIIREGMDSAAYPGAQVLISWKGKIIFHETYGYHTYDHRDTVKKDDLYDLASVTKVMSGLPVLMKLYGEGKFNLDATLGDYFKSFKHSNKADLQIRDILAHQAGLAPYIVYWKNTLRKNGKYKRRTFKNHYSKRYSIKITDDLYLHRKYKKKMIKAICQSPVSDERTYKYSGLFFQILPDIIQSVVEKPFESYLHDSIYTPLGISTLVYNPLNHFPPERIIPTEKDTFFRHKLIDGTVHDEAAAMLNGISCNAGLFGTAEDISKLFQLYLNEGEYKGKQIINPEAIREFTSYQFSDNDNRRGLGFDKPPLEYDPETSYIARDASPSSFGHSGFTGTFVWADPKYDLIVVFLSNRVYPSRENKKLYTLKIRPRIHQLAYYVLIK